VTDIGKPYKLPLRADATRRVISEALAGFEAVDVDAAVEDGTVVVTVTAPSEVDESAVKDLLGRYAISCRFQS
jgi:fatty-acyl-CoA synthase